MVHRTEKMVQSTSQNRYKLIKLLAGLFINKANIYQCMTKRRKKYMFLNERPIPLTLQQIIMVRSRLEKNHYKQLLLEKSERKRWAGYHGELSVDKQLARIDNDKYTIFKDLNLQEKDLFQIDTFLYTSYFGLILEIKNILGTLYFDKHSKQMIRTWKGEREGFANPMLQAQMHQYHLQNWLNKHKIPPIPIEWLVVFSNPATILETTPGNEHIFRKVIHAHRLQEKLLELEAKYKAIEIDKSASKKLRKLLLNENIPQLMNILQKFELHKSEIRTGVRCPICDFIPMLRVSSKWHCPNCKIYSKNAHIHSIYDYLLQNQQTITNQQCRDFLHVTSRRTIYNYLSDFPIDGAKRGIYQLSRLLQDSNSYFLLPKSKQLKSIIPHPTENPI
jgi:hypothetical protein